LHSTVAKQHIYYAEFRTQGSQAFLDIDAFQLAEACAEMFSCHAANVQDEPHALAHAKACLQWTVD